MKWRPYPKYKESGVEWLGEVPEHWKAKALKHVTTCFDNQRIPLNSEERAQRAGEIPYWGANSIVGYVNEALFDEELVLLGEDGAPFFQPFAQVAFHVNGPIWPNNHVHVLSPKRIYGRFLTYLLNPVDFSQFVEGSTRDKLTQSKMKEIPVILPTEQEQRSISHFLDRETAKIDTLIAKQELLIELLQEKRQALISHAVTKGLNPDAPMKSSGIEWLGEVPVHWEVKRLKYTVPSITVGIVVTPAKYYVDDGIPCLRSLNISSKVIDTTDLVYISPESNELLRKSQIRAGDVVVVRTGQTGTAAVVPADLDGANCIDLLIIRRSDSMIPEYLCHFLNAEHTIAQVAAVSEGAIQSHYNTSTLSELRVCAPPIGEQFEILNFLRQKTESIDALLNRTLAAIALMREHRTALISAAVTGKIDVREVHQAAHA